MRFLRPLLAVLLACAALPVVVAGGGAVAEAVAAERGVFELTSMNRRYTELAPDIEPVAWGSMTVTLSSPRHELILERTHLELTALGGGAYDLVLDLGFSGSGELIADLDVGGVRSRLEDELTIPSQLERLEARVRMERVPAGYRITTEELPETFAVEIQSRVAGQVMVACRPLSLFVGIDCNGLDRALSRLAIPLPDPGETYLVESARFSDDELRSLDAFLARTR